MLVFHALNAAQELGLNNGFFLTKWKIKLIGTTLLHFTLFFKANLHRYCQQLPNTKHC